MPHKTSTMWQSPWKKKEAKCLGKIPGMLQSHGDPLGLVLHGLGTCQQPLAGDGMGQDWVSTGEAWGRKVPGWMLDKDKAGSRCFPLCFLVSRLECLSCFMEKGKVG